MGVTTMSGTPDKLPDRGATSPKCGRDWREDRSMGKRVVIAILAGLVVFAGVFAMAASLGGITSTRVGADNTVVASCDTDGVSTSYATSWDATDKRYEITSVTVSGVSDTCDGLTLGVTLTDASGAQIGTGSFSIPTSAATAFTVSMTTAPSAKLTEGIHVLIA
jgi:hypothetical protein